MDYLEQIKNYEPYNEQEAADKKQILYYASIFNDLLTRNNVIAHFSASSFIFNKTRDKIIFIYHNIYKAWTWTGGHADGNENLVEVALKEAEEETGLKNLKVLSDGIYSLEIVTVNGHVKRGKYVSSHLHYDCCFLLEADENDPIRIKEDENKGVKWVNIEDVCKIVSEPVMIPVYTKLNEKLKGY